MYEAIIEAKSCEGRDRLAALAGSHIEAGDDRGFFESLADMLLSFYASNPDYVRLLMFSALEGHEMGEIFVRRHREVFFGPVTEYIERRIRARAFRKVDALLAARAFTGMVSHIGLFSVLLPAIMPKMDRQDLIHSMVKIFLEGVTRRKKARRNSHNDEDSTWNSDIDCAGSGGLLEAGRREQGRCRGRGRTKPPSRRPSGWRPPKSARSRRPSPSPGRCMPDETVTVSAEVPGRVAATCGPTSDSA